MNQGKSIKSFAMSALYLAPAMVVLLVFHIYPVIKTLDMSFYTKYNYFKNIVFERGMGNYTYLIHDEEFWIALQNTFTFVIGVVPASIILSLVIAVQLNKKTWLHEFLRNIYFLPFVTSVVAISAVWRWIYHSQYGVLNYGLESIGIDKIAWLTDPDWALTSLILLCIWKGLGYNIVIIIAGLQTIDSRYEKAALMDGANSWNRFFHITLPLLSPTLFFVSIISTISAFKVFDEVYILFDKMPGPLNSCITMVYYIYDKFANKYMYGTAAAAVSILFVIVMIFTLIQLHIGKRKVHY